MAKKKKSPDFGLIIITFILLAVGIVMVFSSSAIVSQIERGDPYFFLKRQGFWALLGLVGMWFFSSFNYWHLRKLAKIMVVINFILLAAVFIDGIGVEVYGAKRWIGFGGMTIQPAEYTKLALVVFTASHLTGTDSSVRNLTKGIMPVLAVLGVSMLLILKQPDMGTAVAIAGVVFVIMFVAGMSWFHLIVLAGASIPLGIYLIFSEEYRMKRFLSFLNPWVDPLDSGFQIIQSLYALGPGGLFGVGLGRSRQKFFYLPEPHNDFIFAVIGEELGFIGAVLVLLLFFIFIWRGFKIAVRSSDMMGCLLAAGITTMIGLQALMNIAVVTASMPVTGINLPLISAGGSSLFFTLSGIGILINISKYNTI